MLGFAGIRRVSQVGAPGDDGQPFNFRTSAAFWQRTPLKLSTVDNVALCQICQQTVQGDLHMYVPVLGHGVLGAQLFLLLLLVCWIVLRKRCPHSKPTPAPEYVIVPKRKIIRPKTARLHPQHMFKEVAVDTSKFTYSPSVDGEDGWQSSPQLSPRQARPVTAHPLSKSTGHQTGAAASTHSKTKTRPATAHPSMTAARAANQPRTARSRAPQHQRQR